MATPKVDIEQSVGRILRKQKADRTIKPLVIDIYDQFANNINKGKRRITFYRKQKYDIKKMIVDDNQSPPLVIDMKCDKKKERNNNTKVEYKF